MINATQELDYKTEKRKAIKIKNLIGVALVALILIGSAAGFYLTQYTQLDIRRQAYDDDPTPIPTGGGGGGGGGGAGGGWSVTCANGNTLNETSCTVQQLFNNTHGDGCGVWQIEACATVRSTPTGGSCAGGCNANDECDTTEECVAIFGNTATDCANSGGDDSTCMCGSTPCSQGAGGGGTGGGNYGGGGGTGGGDGDPGGTGEITSGGWSVKCNNGKQYSLTSCAEQNDWMNSYNGDFHVACFWWQTGACAPNGGVLNGTCDICDSGGGTTSPAGGSDECSENKDCEELYPYKLGTKECRTKLGGICFCGGLSCDLAAYPQCTHNYSLTECNTDACGPNTTSGYALYEYTTLENGSTECTRVGNCGPPQNDDCQGQLYRNGNECINVQECNSFYPNQNVQECEITSGTSGICTCLSQNGLTYDCKNGDPLIAPECNPGLSCSPNSQPEGATTLCKRSGIAMWCCPSNHSVINGVCVKLQAG